jgi:CRP-like cAMP-binding protein
MKKRKRVPTKSRVLRPTLESARRNAIIASLPGSDVVALTKAGALVELSAKHQVYHQDVRIRDIFFPIDCVFSVVARMRNGTQVEVGTIGREGTTAVPLLLGAATTTNDCYCQVPGKAVKVDVRFFQTLKTASPKFRQLLDSYVRAYVIMLGQLAACNRLHHVYERCARWLLMAHDRVRKPDIKLTHEYLAMMLGTERSGVTVAASTLQKAGFIKYRNGNVTIVDRLGLEQAACECYDVARDLFVSMLHSGDGRLGPVAALT